MPGFMSENISRARCTTIRLCDLDAKPDGIIESDNRMDGLRGFGSNVLANVVGDMIVGKRQAKCGCRFTQANQLILA